MVQIAEVSVVDGWSFLVAFASSLQVVLNKRIVTLNACIGEVALNMWPINKPGGPLEALMEGIEIDRRNEVHESMTKMSSPMA